MMNRLALAFLMLATSASQAQPAGGTVPVCSDVALPDCVTSNWGQVDPDGITAMVRPRADGAGADASPPSIHMAVGAPNAGTLSDHASSGSVSALVSPVGLFPRETAALTSAIKRARFHADGSIASGQPAITAAAAAVARKAGNKYVLTLYVKAPQTIKPDDSARLENKVRTINGLLTPQSPAGTGSKQ